MSVFTVLIIIWGIYQLIVSVTKKKGTQQTPGRSPDSKLPDVPSISDVIQGISRGTWKDQLKQALEDGSYQARPLESTEPEVLGESMAYIETEGIQGIEGTQGTEGTSNYVGILGEEAYKETEETPREEMGMNSLGLRDLQLSLTQRDLVQGVMWVQILGKPRAMHPYRGPRT